MEMSNELPMANGQDREKVCVIGASGKLGRYMVQHALDKGYEVVGVCRPQSVEKLADFADRIEIVAGATDDRSVVEQAVAGCDAVLTVLAPWGVKGTSVGTVRMFTQRNSSSPLACLGGSQGC